MRDIRGPKTARDRADRTGGDAARDVGIDALVFLAADPELTGRFLRLSGLEADDLRHAAADPAFFPALLDFILADERTLQDFAAHSGHSRQSIARTRALNVASSEWPV